MFQHLKLIFLLIPLLVISDHIQAEERKLLILGDSLSAAYNLKQEQGWVSLLQNAWKDQPITIIDAAISGETTDGGLARLPRLLKEHQPTHLLIELGANDGLRGYNIKDLRANLQSMIDLAAEQGIITALQEMRIPTNYGRRYTTMFTESFSILGEKNGLTVIPFFLQDVALEDDLMQQDGLHPNAKAQPIIAEFMDQQLSQWME